MNFNNVIHWLSAASFSINTHTTTGQLATTLGLPIPKWAPRYSRMRANTYRSSTPRTHIQTLTRQLAMAHRLPILAISISPIAQCRLQCRTCPPICSRYTRCSSMSSYMFRTQLYMCPHTAVCVLILQYVCPHALLYVADIADVAVWGYICCSMRTHTR